MKKTSKKSKKSPTKKKKNPLMESSPFGPLDFNLMRKLGIELPDNFNDDPHSTFVHGLSIGLNRLSYALKSSSERHKMETYTIRKILLEKYPNLNKLLRIDFINLIKNMRPSEAFQAGVIIGLDRHLYYMYPKAKSPGVISGIKSYFGLDPNI